MNHIQVYSASTLEMSLDIDLGGDPTGQDSNCAISVGEEYNILYSVKFDSEPSDPPFIPLRGTVGLVNGTSQEVEWKIPGTSVLYQYCPVMSEDQSSFYVIEKNENDDNVLARYSVTTGEKLAQSDTSFPEGTPPPILSASTGHIYIIWSEYDSGSKFYAARFDAESLEDRSDTQLMGGSWTLSRKPLTSPDGSTLYLMEVGDRVTQVGAVSLDTGALIWKQVLYKPREDFLLSNDGTQLVFFETGDQFGNGFFITFRDNLTGEVQHSLELSKEEDRYSLALRFSHDSRRVFLIYGDRPFQWGTVVAICNPKFDGCETLKNEDDPFKRNSDESSVPSQCIPLLGMVLGLLVGSFVMV